MERQKKNAEKFSQAMENIFEKFILIGVREFFIRLLRRHKRHAIAQKKVCLSFFCFTTSMLKYERSWETLKTPIDDINIDTWDLNCPLVLWRYFLKLQTWHENEIVIFFYAAISLYLCFSTYLKWFFFSFFPKKGNF